ncbi:MAG: 5-amino-6-(5-phosphoribosylamino)uracil reductase [Chloroflexi bacterium AL-W]|nr:5-amino-6-(5-phosphoribosylamino)uracil reductase [Chloroflexi bacterium AL-N1]NOK69255.1 5-amino-6-(5-phosphoribosylamino)uracil reductase [Chloroflexi bacterium AL-N10]NOK76316.1 5-amino-6-(5-phosphoribosylamino)uracil reductase [Chloroflexi bacterium AL-N5]NOK83433.1 5-amino-6-(5-phosphoribosylamino)uracil reductase [Chloroflexi bacterium AL-W]NOK91093.1 5-amino-6-(5-phosphoribosylamino)uracil reductase [Chloroflexi bacterium AL-N15]
MTNLQNNIQCISPTDALVLAIAEARSVEGRTSPNPPVGAVVVRDGVVVSRGATQPPGGPHAEQVALQRAGASARGADLVVTLEPCTFHGRTPPCVDAIITAGIRRVFYVAHDPDPRIGNGAEPYLRSADIEIVQLDDPDGMVADLLAPFCRRMTTGRPLVTIKYAMSLDGRIATVTGDSRWISGSESRHQVHLLRDRVDAIMVGVGTVLTDNPALTTRLEQHWRAPQHPLRVIVDTTGRTSLSARILDTALPGTTLFATVNPAKDWVEGVLSRGAQVEFLPSDTHGRVDVSALLLRLGTLGVNHLLVEGGSTLLGSLAAEQLIDRIWAFVAPKLVGGQTAPGPFGNPGVTRLADALPLHIRRVERHDNDILMIGEL